MQGPVSQQRAAANGLVRRGHAAVSARRTMPVSGQLSMGASGAASETGLGHVFVSLFPGAVPSSQQQGFSHSPPSSLVSDCLLRRTAGPMRYTASLLMPLSALLSIGGAMYGHQLAYYLASVLPLAQAGHTAVPRARLQRVCSCPPHWNAGACAGKQCCAPPGTPHLQQAPLASGASATQLAVYKVKYLRRCRRRRRMAACVQRSCTQARRYITEEYQSDGVLAAGC